ncbi:MAG: N-acetylglucosamine-6-phosphate deacetylase [Clostridia bacterium]|nr:N-acetylglucosamine-6-phosphate deacetylase [Clostridia bacterium]
MDDYKILKNALVDGSLADIVVRAGKIVSIGKTSTTGEFIDIGGNHLFPGLIDIHSHGCIGHDTMDATPMQMAEMRRFMKKNGVTTWLPTTMTMPMEDIEGVMSTGLIDIEEEGCDIVGFHMEGPYINPKYKGAQNESYIKNPSVEEFKKLECVKMVTVAPELCGSEELIKYCAENGIVVSLGHTDCDFDCAERAFLAGAKCLTHTFNAMPPMLHRAPGPIGAALLGGGYAQVICDGEHIHKAAIMALYSMFGADRMVLISDSMQATGLGDGSFVFGGLDITVKNGVARTDSGALAGSTTTLFGCVKKAIEFGIPKKDAIKMATATPADLLGIKKGRIEVGYSSEFIILDSDFNLVDTLILKGDQI